MKHDLENMARWLKTEMETRKPHLDPVGVVSRVASVLLLFLPGAEGPELVFEVRSNTLNWQPGEISFPGGSRESGDRNFAEAAVREAMEELGVRPVDIRLCGTLDFFSAHNTFMIYPFVGVWQPGQEGCRLDPSNRGETADRLLVSAPDYRQWHFNRDEVAELFTVPLRHLLAQEPRVATSVVTMTHLDDFPYDLMPQTPKDWSRVRKYPIYFYTYQGRVIWGITASILHGFLERFRKGLVDFA